MIDEIDQQIIILLQEDARLSNAAIAEKVGLTTSTIHERVKKLEKKGLIKGYVAVVDPEAVGKSIMAFIRLTLASTTVDYLESKNGIVEICNTEPDILECHGTAGEDCYILKVRVASPQDLEKLIERIRCNVPVLRSITSIVLSTLKETSKVTPHSPIQQ
jgi:Lrp/AsnC family transcriptional regulator, leucine-responsive regulatory protein